MNISNYNKIIIVGNNGSGKSYLSEELANITGLPLIHLDLLYWRPNWQPVPKDKWYHQVKQLISLDRWLIDGNYSGTMDIRYKASDLVIFLDINMVVCIISAIKRYGKKRSDLPEYLDDKLDKNFYIFFKGLLLFPMKRKKQILKLHNKYPDIPLLRIKSRKEMKKIIINWQSQYKKI